MEELELIVIEPEVAEELPGHSQAELDVLRTFIDIPSVNIANLANSLDSEALEQLLRELENR